MKILQVHNSYKKQGGEDSVVVEEKLILEKNGHTVLQYCRDNAELDSYSTLDLIRLMSGLRNSPGSGKDLLSIITREKPDVCHVHNVFMLVSPVVYKVCRNMGIPVVQTLHNYRLLCTNSTLYRDGHICEECIGRSALHSVKYKCYRDSYLQTLFLADTIQYHRRKSTWTTDIDAYICLSEFARQKFIEGGLPADKLFIKPNFVKKPEIPATYGDFLLFVGRLERTKGLFDLIEVAKRSPGTKFVVLGDCDDPSVLAEAKNIEYLGSKSRREVIRYMSECKAVVFPSVWYEGMPMVILEAFSMKKGVIARDIGAMAGIITHGETGLKYRDMDEFHFQIQRLESEVALSKQLGERAYSEYQAKYSPAQGYRNLINIYNRVKGIKG